MPHKRKFETTIKLLRGNDSFDGLEPSLNSSHEVAQDLIEPADFVCQRKESKVSMLGIPDRDENRIGASQANATLKGKAASKSPKHDVEVKWKYRSVCSFTSGRRYFNADKIHSSNDGLNDIKNLIRAKKSVLEKQQGTKQREKIQKCLLVKLTAVVVQVPGEIHPNTVNSPKVPSGTTDELKLSSPPICALVFQGDPEVPPDKSKPGAFCSFVLVGYKT